MLFLVQKDSVYDVDKSIFLSILHENRFVHSYKELTLQELKDLELSENYKNALPFGNIDFVTLYLNKYHNIEQMNPIEIPDSLRTYEFLKRDYRVVKGEEVPKSGYYFIKDASQLKHFSFSGDMLYFNTEEIWKEKQNFFDTTLRLDKNHYFVVSEHVNILSEYRVYILDGEIANISLYDGDATVLPDVNLIKKANLIYSTQKDYPKSYTMDVMVTNRGTAIIECHILFSTGLYTTNFNDNLLYGYRDALNYLLNYNTKIKVFK